MDPLVLLFTQGKPYIEIEGWVITEDGAFPIEGGLTSVTVSVVAISTGAAVTVSPDAGATVTIKDSALVTVYSGASGSVALPQGSYTWTATASSGFEISGSSSGSFTVSGDSNRMGGTGAIRKPPRPSR